MIYASPAVTNSVKQKAYHTPSAPMNLLNIYAAGMMTTAYRSREIHRDGVPLPRPSKAPQQVIETADTTNPRLMI